MSRVCGLLGDAARAKSASERLNAFVSWLSNGVFNGLACQIGRRIACCLSVHLPLAKRLRLAELSCIIVLGEHAYA